MTHHPEAFAHCNCQACARRAWAERDALLRAASKLILAAADQYAAAWRDLKAAVASAQGEQP